MSSNPGLLPDGTPSRTYQERLDLHNNPQLATQIYSSSSFSDKSSRTLGFNRPQQQHNQPPSSHPSYPYYNQPNPNPYSYPPNYQTTPYPPYPPPNSYSSQINIPPPPTAVAPPPPPPPPPPPQTPGQPSSQQQQQQQQQQHSNIYSGYHTPYNPQQAAPPHPNPVGAVMPNYFRPSGRRKALLVGINYRGTTAELRGCVRDVTFVHHLLTSKFGFRNSEFVILTDEATGISGVRRGAPTRRTILDSLRWLVSDTHPGDSLWFSFSGHGSQIRDTSGDESDGYDETILPVDYRKTGHIVDDELYDIVRRVCRGSRLTVLLDACHSGTGLDLPYQHDVFGTGSGQRISGSGRPSITQGIMGVAGALLSGNASGALSAGLNLATGRKKKGQPGPDPNGGEVLLFSGCKDNQTSADTSKLSGGLTTGAMTYALIETLEHSTVGDWRNYTYRKLLQTMRQKLRANRMTQTPQFSTSHPFDLDSLFII